MLKRNLERNVLLLVAAAVGLSAIAASSSPHKAAKSQNRFLQTNLLADTPGAAANTDSHLVNPWGISASATSPFWISDNGMGVTTLSNGAGVPPALVVTIPTPDGTGTSKPTGQVFNSFAGAGAFAVAATKPAFFIFATEDGTISGWNPTVSASAIKTVDNSPNGAVYKGLAIGSAGGNPYLYAPDFHNGTIDVFDGRASVSLAYSTRAAI